jgi:hypothetical protein
MRYLYFVKFKESLEISQPTCMTGRQCEIPTNKTSDKFLLHGVLLSYLYNLSIRPILVYSLVSSVLSQSYIVLL